MGRPKIVPDNVTVALVDLCKVLRSFQMPVFHTTVIAHFKRLTDGTELGRKFQKKSGDGWDWHEGKLDNWFKRHFLGEHPELATGGQMSIDVARNNWCISDNVKYYFDNVEMQLLRVTYCALFWVVSWRSVVITDMPSCLLVQHKIAYINTNYVPFELTDAHFMLSDKAFKEVLRNLEPKADGFNATKQAHFAKVYIETGRTSLGFQDAILCLKGAWKASVGDREIQRRAWFNGGCMPFHRVPQYIMEREKQKVLKSLAVKAAKAAPGASAGMEQGDALHWDRLMACVPLKNRFGGSAPVVGAAAGAGAAADEDSEEEDGDDPRHSVRSTGNRASDCFNTHVDRRGHKSKMAEMQRALMKADKGQLKAFYDEIKSDDPEFTFHWEKKDTVDKVKLAIFEYSIKLFNFNVLPSAYPSKLKKEVARQAVERGDVPAAEVAAAPAPPVKFFSFLTDANRIFPRGAKYNHVLSSADAMAEDTVVAVPTLPTVAAPVLGGAPPWSVPAAAGGAMDVEPLSAAEIMAKLERRQADTLVMMAEFQRKTASESAQAEKAARARVGTAPCDPVDMAN